MKQEEWTEIISSKYNLTDLKLKEVWLYRDLVILFIKRNFIATYKQTVLGWFWHIITPFINIVLYILVFNKIANLSTEGVPPFLFQSVSYTHWGFLVGCFGAGSGVFGGNAHLFSKVYFPRLSLPISSCLTSLVNLMIQVVLVSIVWIVYIISGIEVFPTQYILLMPFLLLTMLLLGLGSGMIISSLTTKYRDLQNLVGYGVAAAMYGSAVLYPLSQIPEHYKPYVSVNPMISIMEAIRFAFLGIGGVDWLGLGIAFMVAIIIFLIGLIAFNRAERNFIDTV